jgi:hypothetical protein
MQFMIINLFQYIAYPYDYFGNRLREYELNLRLKLNLTRGFDVTAWPYDAAPTDANAFYQNSINSLGEHINYT